MCYARQLTCKQLTHREAERADEDGRVERGQTALVSLDGGLAFVVDG